MAILRLKTSFFNTESAQNCSLSAFILKNTLQHIRAKLSETSFPHFLQKWKKPRQSEQTCRTKAAVPKCSIAVTLADMKVKKEENYV